MRILILLIALLVPVSGWGATYYVSPTGSNTAPYDTWAKAANLPHTAVTHASGVTGPHTIYIGPGTYVNSYLDLNDADLDNVQIIGVTSQVDTTPAPNKLVTIRVPAVQWGVHFRSRTGAVVRGLTFEMGAGSYDVFSFDSTNCKAIGCYGYDAGRNLIRAGGGSGNQVISCLLEGATDFGVVVLGSASISIYNTIIKAYGTKRMTSVAVRNQGTGTLNIYNSTVLGQQSNGIENSSTGTTSVINSIVGSGQSYTSGYALLRTSGTLNVTNSQLYHRAFGTTGDRGLSFGSPTLTNNVYGGKWGHTQMPRRGFIIPRFDDGYSAAYAKNMIPVFRSRNVRAELTVESAAINSYASDILACHDSGVFDIGVHSYSHSAMDLTGSAFSVTKAGATIDVNRGSDTITVSPGGVITGFKAKTLAAIRAELVALGCSNGALATNLEGITLGEVLADSSGAQASPYTAQILIDTTANTGFYKVEMRDAKSQMEAFLGANVTTFSTPKGLTNASAQAAAKAAGYDAIVSSLVASDRQTDLSSIHMYRMGYMWANALVDSTDELTRNHVRALCVAVAQTGMIVTIIAHDVAGVGVEVSAENWALILDTIAEFNDSITVTSIKEAVRQIKESGDWSTSDQTTYTRTWIDSFDYKIRTGSSSLIKAGTPISGLTTDFAGKAWKNPPSIGAYEYYRKGGGGWGQYNFGFGW